MSGLQLHQSEDLREAVQSLALVLADANLGLLEKPWLVVPSAGIRQWLDGALSENLGVSVGSRDGVTANLSYFFPEQLVGEVERQVLASIGKVRLNWSKELIALRIFGMGGAADFAHARRVGETIDNLNRWRPDVLLSTADDEYSEVRKIYRDLGTFGLLPHEQRKLVLETLRTQSVSALPSLIALVGLTNMPGGSQFGELLAALSTQCLIQIFEPVTTLEPITTDPEFLPARWNAEVLEARKLYGELAESLGVKVTATASSKVGSSTLRNLQQSMKSGIPSIGAAADETVKVIGAYGNSRQVETLRTELLDILGNKELGISPHEILVLTPDLPSFGPLLERHWLYEKEMADSPRLPIDYAERPTGQFASRFDASVELLKLIGTRVTVDQLSDFVAIPPVGIALNLSADEQDRIWALATENKVMAGTSNEQRAPFELMPAASVSGVPVNVGTWERFIDGVATTYIMPDQALSNIRGIGTIDDVELLARLIPLLQILEGESYLRTTRVKKDLASWLSLIEEWMNQLIPSTDKDRSFEREVLKFREWLNELPTTIEITVTEFQELWRGIDTPSTSPNVFGRGGIVVCGLSALPNVPFKVVALVGFDESNLPGASVAEGLSGDRRIGEPNPRQSLLQALTQGIMSADQRLIITYSANSDESGEPVEAAIPLEELLEGLAGISAGGFKPIGTSRHEFFLSPDQESGRSVDPRVQELRGIDGVQPSNELDFTQFLDPTRTNRRVLSVKDLTSFFDNPQKFFLSAVAGAQWPSAWPQTVGGASFEWDKWTTSDLNKELIREIRTYIAAHPEVNSIAHLVHDRDILDHSLVTQNSSIAEAFDDFYHGLLDGLVVDTAKTGAIPPAIWQTAIKRQEIVNEAFMIETEFERFELIESPFPRTFMVGDWNVDASSELGDLGEAEFKVYRDRSTGSLKLVEFVSEYDRYKVDKNGPLTKKHFRAMIGLLLFKAAGLNDVTAELLYIEEPLIYKRGPAKGAPKGAGKTSVSCTIDIHDAQLLLEEIIGAYAAVWAGPVPFFPRTTFALVSGKSGQSEWEGSFNKPGESEKTENQILYPYNYEDLRSLIARETSGDLVELPFVKEINEWRMAFEFGETTTAQAELAPRIQAAIDAVRERGGA